MKKVLPIFVFSSILGIILALFLLPACVSNPDIDKQVSSLSKENPDFQRQVLSLKRNHTKNVQRQISSLQRGAPNVDNQVSLLKRKKDPNIDQQLSLLQKSKPIINTEISCLFECEIKEGKLKDLKKLINKMILNVKENEPGTLDYEFFFNIEEKRLYVFQRYRNNQSAMIHMEGFNQFLEKFMSLVELKNLNVFGPVENDFKNAVQGLKVTYQDLYLKK